MIPDGMKPKRFAQSLMLTELWGIYMTVKNAPHGGTLSKLTERERNLVLREIAITHNNLLSNSNLDGLELEVPA